jgi:hypothetical protein
MGYFTLNLPGNKKGDVRYGPVKKMKTLSHRFRRRNFDEEQLAYIVKVDTGYISERVYYLLKTKDGFWLDEFDSEATTIIKKTIDAYKHQLMAAC